MLNKNEWQTMFESKLSGDSYLPASLAAILVLQESLERDDSKTLQELLARTQQVRAALCAAPSAGPEIDSAGELFTKYITKDDMSIERAQSFPAVRTILTKRGVLFVAMCREAPKALSKQAQLLLDEFDNPNIVTYSWNASILQTFIDAHKRGCKLNVHVMESNGGEEMVRALRAAGASASVVPASTLAHYVSNAAFVAVPAVAVGQCGNVVAKFGASTLVTLARALDRKVVVMAEMFRCIQEDVGSGAMFMKEVKIAMEENGESGLPAVEVVSRSDIWRLCSDYDSLMLPDAMQLFSDYAFI